MSTEKAAAATHGVADEQQKGASTTARLAVVGSHLASASAHDLAPASQATASHILHSLSAHALDTKDGQPASSLPLVLERLVSSDDQWALVFRDVTNSDGRLSNKAPALAPGHYRMSFDTTTYYQTRKVEQFFYPVVRIEFTIFASAKASHYHIPLLLSPFGFTTYRGS
mmetsp:Transcript_33095/g.83186  ORF Transcript_33095/g.83186 Transcript_33095/m.83186 type:complete len:169 (-) Transcript_33095:109-615(-)